MFIQKKVKHNPHNAWFNITEFFYKNETLNNINKL